MEGESFLCLLSFSKESKLVLIRARVHPFPFRTRKLSSLLPKILVWRRTGKIGSANTKGRNKVFLPFFFFLAIGFVYRGADNMRLRSWKSPVGPRILKTALAVTLSLAVVEHYGASPAKVVFATIGAMSAVAPTFTASLLACLTQDLRSRRGGLAGADRNGSCGSRL